MSALFLKLSREEVLYQQPISDKKKKKKKKNPWCQNDGFYFHLDALRIL